MGWGQGWGWGQELCDHRPAGIRPAGMAAARCCGRLQAEPRRRQSCPCHPALCRPGHQPPLWGLLHCPRAVAWVPPSWLARTHRALSPTRHRAHAVPEPLAPAQHSPCPQPHLSAPPADATSSEGPACTSLDTDASQQLGKGGGGAPLAPSHPPSMAQGPATLPAWGEKLPALRLPGHTAGSATGACPFPPGPVHPGVSLQGPGDAAAQSHHPCQHPEAGLGGCQAPCRTPCPAPCLPVSAPCLWLGGLVFPRRSMRPSILRSSAGCSPTALLINWCCCCCCCRSAGHPERLGCLHPALPVSSQPLPHTVAWRPHGSWHPPRTHA